MEDCEVDEKSGEYSMYNIINGSVLEVWMVDIELCGKLYYMEIDLGEWKLLLVKWYMMLYEI